MRSLRPGVRADIGGNPGILLRAGTEAEARALVHDSRMTANYGTLWPKVALAAAWAAMVGAVITILLLEQKLRDAGRGDLVADGLLITTIFLMAIAGAAIVGSTLALRRPGHPAGWLFLTLAISIVLSGVGDVYAMYGAIHDPGSLPGAALVAVYADGIFLPWVTVLGLILLLTPTGSAPTPRWRVVGWVLTLSCAVFLVAIPFRSVPLEGELVDVRSPLVDESYSGLAGDVAFVAVLTAHLALLAAIASLVYRVRRAGAEERQQLRWMLVPAIPFPFLVAGAWVAAAQGSEAILVVLGGGYLVIIPIAAGLAIEKRRLYDIDRIINRTVAYTLLSGVVVAAYVAIVLTVGIAGGRAASRSVPVAVTATLAATALGGFTRKRFQDTVDRRFNRRSFTALERVRGYVRHPLAGVTVEQTLRDATGDPGLSVAYWSQERRAWVGEDGSPVSPATHAFEMQTGNGSPGAAISFDESRSDTGLIASLAAEARPEIENARLRAAISLQLLEVRESRTRIVSAQLAERKRIERDLHDGSQQRLLALAMNLRATEMSHDAEAALRSLPGAIAELQTTVRELRELANGLHPGVLEDGGLSAALQELAARAPIPIRLDVLEKRLPGPVESSAWFIACEAIANVVKHARASAVSLAAHEDDGLLVLSIDDDGVGGADAAGHGLRGMADRAEAAGGSLSIHDRAGGGTSIRAVLPCAL